MGEVSHTTGTALSGSYNPLSDPLTLFIVQLLIIVILSRIIGRLLVYLHQPRVVAEVLVGIILGPSALSRIPEFQTNVFPKESITYLKMIADLGLIFFLFLVGLEMEPRTLIRSAKVSAFISLAGIALPFALGVGASKALYEIIMVPEFNAQNKPVPPFTSFLTFTGVAMSITAFPVLARMLTERKLFGTKVGLATISAAAVDDAMAWILLILVVALINNPANSTMALYVFLCVVAWALVLWFAVRPIILRVARKDLQEDANDISPFTVLFIFVVMLISAAFAQIVGVHAIFGAFLAGIIMPHEHGFAVKLTEKIEDLVTILFLPLYFTYSGLNTRIDQLKDGESWGMVLLVIAVAVSGKVVGCSLAARTSGLSWRESWTVGFLMSTKGLVELIVLNLGLSAGVITERVFTIMVVMALVTTFLTMPVVSWIYPKSFYLGSKAGVGTNLSLAPPSTKDLPGLFQLHQDGSSAPSPQEDERPLRILLTLPKIQTIAPMMALTQLLRRSRPVVPSKQSASGEQEKLLPGAFSLDVLRLIPLTDRTSAVILAAEAGTEAMRWDPIIDVFQMFCRLNQVKVTPHVAVVPPVEFAENIVGTAAEAEAVLFGDGDLEIMADDREALLLALHFSGVGFRRRRNDGVRGDEGVSDVDGVEVHIVSDLLSEALPELVSCVSIAGESATAAACVVNGETGLKTTEGGPVGRAVSEDTVLEVSGSVSGMPATTPEIALKSVMKSPQQSPGSKKGGIDPEDVDLVHRLLTTYPRTIKLHSGESVDLRILNNNNIINTSARTGNGRPIGAVAASAAAA
ncbi:K(+)/H(+) antiporter, partial [Quaeritorhiza haematococci]